MGLAHWFSVRQLPWATLAVNVVGCFAIGVLFELFEERLTHMPSALRIGLVGGLLGGLTTFSAFGLETVLLAMNGRTALALLYIGASVGIGLAAVAAGIVVSRAVS